MTGFLFSGGGAYNLEGIFSVRTYGAVGDGVADDTAAINACFAAAWAFGPSTINVSHGAIVFFPPGSYKVSSTIVAFGASKSITITGCGMFNTTIFGTINSGFVLDKPDPSSGEIYSIRDICIMNKSTTPGTGALRFSFVNSASLENLRIEGYIGVDVGSDQFQSRYANIHINSGLENQPPGSVGMICGNATYIGCNIQGYETGYQVGSVTQGSSTGSPGVNFLGCRVESCAIGFYLGKTSLGALWPAGVTMVGCQSERCTETIIGGSVATLSILGGAYTATAAVGHYFYPSHGGSLTWSGGTATLTIPADLPSLTDYGWTSGTRSVTISSAEAATLTVTNAVWSAGTTTYTTSNPLTAIGWSSGTRTISIGGIDPPSMALLSGTGTRTGTNTFTVSGVPDPGQAYASGGTVSISPGYNTPSSYVTATRTGARTFTYPVTVDPGSANTNEYANWSFRTQSCVKLLTASYVTIDAVGMSITNPEIATIDMTTLDGGFIAIRGTNFTTVALPAGSKKAGISLDQCTFASLNMVFADLPGQTGVWLNTYVGAKEGMEYDITDATIAGGVWGGIVTGGGSTHCRVRYNGTNWTAMGK